MRHSPLRSSVLAFTLFTLCACATTGPVQRSAQEHFQEAEELYASKHFEDAVAEWKRVKETYASPELTTLAELKIADAQFAAGTYIEAAASYEEFRKLHPTHEKSAYALYQLGLCQYNQIAGIDTDQTPVANAISYFEEFLRKYPTSEYVPDATEKLEIARQKQVQYEIYVGSFYYRSGKHPAAIKRLTEALQRFPTALHDETLYYLGAAYLRNGDRDKARDSFNRLAKEYPSSRFVNEARKTMDKYY